MRKMILTSALLFALVGCTPSSKEYTVTMNFDNEALEGRTVYLKMLNNDKLDSVVVQNNTAQFQGSLEKPIAVMAMPDMKKVPFIPPAMFVLEAGNIVVNGTYGVGTPLNDKLAQFIASIDKNSENVLEAIDKLYNENRDNQLAVVAVMTRQVSGMIFESISDNYRAIIEMIDGVGPTLKGDVVLAGMRENAVEALKTEKGEPFIDIEFDADKEGVVRKLSDYVGKGKFIVVDFKALPYSENRSWSVLKEVRKEFDAKVVDIVTVFTLRDDRIKVDDVLAEVKPDWPVERSFNGSVDVKSLYRTNYSNELVLIAPDGTILARRVSIDKLKEELNAFIKR